MTRTMMLVIAWMTLGMVGRGLDYLLGNPEAGRGAFTVADVTPTLVWGVSCLGVALWLVQGMARRSVKCVRNGAFLATGLYLTFSLVVLEGIVAPPIDDWRFLTSYVATAGVWGTLTWSLTVRLAVDRHREEVTHDGVGDSYRA